MSAASRSRIDRAPAQSALPSHGYRVVSAENGGWILLPDHGDENPYLLRYPLGAFTNSADLLAWLTNEHRKLDEARAQRAAGDTPKEDEAR